MSARNDLERMARAGVQRGPLPAIESQAWQRHESRPRDARVWASMSHWVPMELRATTISACWMRCARRRCSQQRASPRKPVPICARWLRGCNAERCPRARARRCNRLARARQVGGHVLHRSSPPPHPAGTRRRCAAAVRRFARSGQRRVGRRASTGDRRRVTAFDRRGRARPRGPLAATHRPSSLMNPTRS